MERVTSQAVDLLPNGSRVVTTITDVAIYATVVYKGAIDSHTVTAITSHPSPLPTLSALKVPERHTVRVNIVMDDDDRLVYQGHDLPEWLVSILQTLIRDSHKIQAIKLLRCYVKAHMQTAAHDLRSAKDYIDKLAER